MKKRVIVNYSSAFGLPGVQPDAGMALIHLLESKSIKLDAIVVSGAGPELNRVTAAIDWLLKFSGRTDLRVFGRCSDAEEKTADEAEREAADLLTAFLNESEKTKGGKAVLLDIGEPQVLKLAAARMTSLSDYFSAIVFWNPGSTPPQRRGAAYPHGSLQDETLYSVYTESCCPLTSFGEEAAFQSPLDIDELVDIRSSSKPLFYLLKDYLLCRAADANIVSQDFLYRLPPAVYLTNPELFSIQERTKNGFTFNICPYITDIKAYNSILHSSWTSWHKQEASL